MGSAARKIRTLRDSAAQKRRDAAADKRCGIDPGPALRAAQWYEDRARKVAAEAATAQQRRPWEH